MANQKSTIVFDKSREGIDAIANFNANFDGYPELVDQHVTLTGCKQYNAHRYEYDYEVRDASGRLCWLRDRALVYHRAVWAYY
jgi:hypothetical protein